MKQYVHFGSFDGRFCGSDEKERRLTLNENDVTCPACKAKDGLVLTDEGKRYLASIGAV